MNINDDFLSNIMVFDKSNRGKWCVLMKYLFRAQKVIELVQNGYEELSAEPTDAKGARFKESKKKNYKVYSTFNKT